MAEQTKAKPIYKNSIVVAVGFVVLLIGSFILYQFIMQTDFRKQLDYRGAETRSKLKEIGLALHNYHDVWRVLPIGGVIVEGKESGSGWDKLIYPFMHQAPITHNREYHNLDSYVVKRKEAFWNPAIETTHDAEGNPLNHYSANLHIFFKNSSTRIKDISDSLEHTFFVGEIAEGLKSRGDPTNYRDPSKGLNKGPDTFGRPSGEGAYFVMGDGSVRFIDNDIDPKILKALATSNGGETIPEGF